jgi:hypothetical protein
MNIDNRKPASARTSHDSWYVQVHPQFNWLYWCKSKVARQLGLCAELPSFMRVRPYLVSNGCECMHQLGSWLKYVQYGLICRRVNLLRSEGFVKENVIDKIYLKKHRQIKLCCGSKRNSNPFLPQYSQGCTKFLASLELFYSFPTWLTAENILMPVFSD